MLPKKLAEALIEAACQHVAVPGQEQSQGQHPGVQRMASGGMVGKAGSPNVGQTVGGTAGAIGGNFLVPGGAGAVAGGMIGGSLGGAAYNLVNGNPWHEGLTGDSGPDLPPPQDIFPTQDGPRVFDRWRGGAMGLTGVGSIVPVAQLQAEWYQRHPEQAPLPDKQPVANQEGAGAPGNPAGMAQVPGAAPAVSPNGLLPGETPGGYSSVVRQQQDLAHALLQQAQGRGVSPAQDLLNRQTGQNIAGQAALMASQRGASANAGLLARQAAMQGAGIQQNAIGQAAALRSQEQLAAMGQLGNHLAQMGNQSLGQSGLGVKQLEIQGYMDRLAEQQRNQMYGQAINGTAAGIQAWMNSNNQNNNTPAFDWSTTDQTTPQYAPPTSTYGGGNTLMQSMGGKVPGQAPVKGDSKANDVVPALLSPGEVVIPRSVVQGPNMEEKVLEFLQSLKPQKLGYGGVIRARKGKC